MALTPGTRLGPYEITAQIGVCDSLGTGGMGEVYRATDTKLKRPVAIKVLPASLAALSLAKWRPILPATSPGLAV